MDFRTTLVKCILYIFSAVTLVLGVLLIVYGVTLGNSIASTQIDNEMEFLLKIVFTIAPIALGVIVVCKSFVGYCGLIKENVAMIRSYSMFMLLLLILHLIIISLLYFNRDEYIHALNDVIDEAWLKEKNNPGFFEPIQELLHCCGANGPSDYVLILKAPTATCCEPGSFCSPLKYYGGCKEKLVQFATGTISQINYLSIGIIGVEALGFVLSFWLANTIYNNKRRNAY